MVNISERPPEADDHQQQVRADPVRGRQARVATDPLSRRRGSLGVVAAPSQHCRFRRRAELPVRADSAWPEPVRNREAPLTRIPPSLLVLVLSGDVSTVWGWRLRLGWTADAVWDATGLLGSSWFAGPVLRSLRALPVGSASGFVASRRLGRRIRSPSRCRGWLPVTGTAWSANDQSPRTKVSRRRVAIASRRARSPGRSSDWARDRPTGRRLNAREGGSPAAVVRATDSSLLTGWRCSRRWCSRRTRRLRGRPGGRLSSITSTSGCDAAIPRRGATTRGTCSAPWATSMGSA